MTLPLRRAAQGVQSCMHQERRAVDGKFSAKPESEKGWRGREGGDMKGKANPQKPFDISHQSTILTFLTLHFQLGAKSSP